MIKIIAAFICIALLGLLFILNGDDLNKAALINYNGQIDEGSFAGVVIGARESSARQALTQKGLISVPYQNDGTCPINGNFETVISFVDLSWRKGNVCVGISDGLVRSVAWRYNFMQP